LNVALFAFAALGWYASKWAGRRFSVPRKSSKLCKVDWEDSCDNTTLDADVIEEEEEDVPSAPALTHMSSGVRRRVSQRAAAAVATAAAVPEAADCEKAVDVAEEAQVAAKAGDETTSVDKADFHDVAGHCDVGAELSEATVAVEPCAVSAEVVKLVDAATSDCSADIKLSDGISLDDTTASDLSCEQATDERLTEEQAPSTSMLPSPVATASEDMKPLDSSYPGDEQDAQPMEAAVSEKVAKMMAKKAARKARKAEERKQLQAQLAEAPVKDAEEASHKAKGCEAASRAEGKPSDKVAVAPELDDIDVVQAPLDADAGEPDEEPPFHGVATWSGPESTPEWPELGKAGDAGHWSPAAWSQPAGRQRAWTQPAFNRCEERVEDEWMVPMEDMVGLAKESENGVVQALDPNINVFQPIMTEGGQQFYTDGQQVYMMAAMTVDTGMVPDAEIAAEPPVITPVVDPYDPLHHAFMSLSAAVAMGPESPCNKAGPWAFAQDEYEAYEQDDDALWNVCWDFA